MTGIYGGDGEQLSLAATFPQLRTLELEHGSLIRGLLAQSAEKVETGPPFLTLRPGMDALVEALVGGFERTRVVTGVGVRNVARGGDGYRVALDDDESIEADAVVVAVPAFAAAELLADLDEELAARTCGDPVRLVGGRDARIPGGGRRASARRVRVRRSAHRRDGRPRVHLDVAGSGKGVRRTGRC